MSASAAEIEAIVRVVIERLRTARAAPADATKLPTSADGQSAVTNPDELLVSERVITLELLKGMLPNKKIVRVHPRAVVTPAAQDELRSRGITLVRGGLRKSADASRITPLLLIATVNQQPVLSKRVCPQQARVSLASNSVNEDLKLVESHLAASGRGVIWCSATPFAAVIASQTSGTKSVRAVQLTNPAELQAAIAQAQPNLLIVDHSHWSIAALENLVKNWHRSMS